MIKKLRKELPMLVKALMLNANGWLVGSSIKAILEDAPVKDYDILVSDRKLFQTTINMLAKTYLFELNSCGGFKFSLPVEEGTTVIVDIWCQELGDFLTENTGLTYLFNINKLILLKNTADIK